MKQNDWRLTNQMNYLYQKTLTLIPFTPDREGWEHEHCAFCSERIETGGQKAYATLDRYHWICQDCFNDFKEQFQWSVKE